MKKLLMLLIPLALAGCATAPTGTTIPPDVMAACRAEGGCTLFSATKLDEVLREAFELGVLQGQGRKGGL